MGNPAKNCRWILANSTYCEKPVRYTMVWDGGEVGSTKVREYESFCPEHKAKLKQRNDDDE